MELTILNFPYNKKVLIKYKNYELMVFRDEEDPFNIYSTVDFKPINIFKINKIVKVYDTYISLNRTKTELFKVFYDHFTLAKINDLRDQFPLEDGVNTIYESEFKENPIFKELTDLIKVFVTFQIDNGLFTPDKGIIFQPFEFLQAAYNINIVSNVDLPL